MWITNGRHGDTFLLLARTGETMSAFAIEKGRAGADSKPRTSTSSGTRPSKPASCTSQDFPVPAENLIGGVEGQGFRHVMTGLEAERINVAARGLGHRAGGLRRSDPVFAAVARPLASRSAEHQAIQTQAGRHGDQDRSLAAADLLRGGEKRPRRALRPGSRDGQAVRHRDGGRSEPSMRCAFWAATAIRRTFRSSGITGTRRCW